MIDELKALARNLRERLVAHAEGHIKGEQDAVEMVGLADELVSLANRLVTPGTPVVPIADAALREANAIAVVIGQYQSRMMNTEKYHAELAKRAPTLRRLLNAAGYPAPGSVPEG